MKQIEGVAWTEVDTSKGRQDISMTLVADEFAVTRPPKAPERRDRERMAAINDRYDGVRQVLKTTTGSLSISRGPALRWEPGPGRALTIPFGFEQLPIRTRIEQLAAAIFRAFPDVRTQQESNYVRLAPRLCNHRTPGFAFSALDPRRRNAIASMLILQRTPRPCRR